MNGRGQRNQGGGVQFLLDHFRRTQLENPDFFYAVQSNNDRTGVNVFWADVKSRLYYKHFGDTVVFDTTYKSNRYGVPFASFTGINHHGQPVLFGCALIFSESEATLVWLFQTWLEAMSGQPPVSITTDLNRYIQGVVTQVLPGTRHRFAKQAIFRETREKLDQIFQSHPTLETEFKKCINDAETVDEFESSWQSLLQRYFVMDDEWLVSLYNAREQWVPIYTRDRFFGELFVSEGSGAVSSFFDGYVSASTTVQTLIKQYEKAVAAWQEKELTANYETTSTTPVLKTPSPMEKQAANIYTRKVFLKFQEELVETLANPAKLIDNAGTFTTYHVAKFGEDHKARTVSFDSSEMKASCSCQMFEYSGIICRHILAVFRAKNVLTLPSQYVMKRWTRDARSGSTLEENDSESPSSREFRYNNLRQQAMKYVGDGAKSIHVYRVAIEAIREGTKTVASVKGKSSTATHAGSLANGSTQEMQVEEQNRSVTEEEKEQKIQELTAKLENTNKRCEVYRTSLLAVLEDMEEQKQKLAVEVQNAKLSLKEW